MSRSTTTARTRSSSATSFGVLRAASTAAAALLAACAGYSPGALQPGSSEADLRARMGEPTDRYARADGGWVAEYAHGPMGKHTYRVELDAAGRVRGWQQLLTEARFDAVAVGAVQADVRLQLGRPSEVRTGWRGVGEVWSYRYEALFYRWFQVWLVAGSVREAGYAPDPQCDEPRRMEPPA